MQITEENVVEQLQQKNPLALEYLMNTYGKNVYALVSNILRDLGRQEDMEECASDVFAGAWEKSQDYHSSKGSLKTWVFMLAKYKALDYRRRMYRDKINYQEGELEKVASGDRVESEVLLKEEIKQVTAIIAGLGEMDRQIFYRRYFLYEPVEEIAKQFDLTRKAVDNRLWRTRKRLKEEMAQEGGGVV